MNMNEQRFYLGIDFYDNDVTSDRSNLVKLESQFSSYQEVDNQLNNNNNNNNNNIVRGNSSYSQQPAVAMDSLSNNPILTTASMPIPSRSNLNNQSRVACDLSDFIYDLDSQSPQPKNDMVIQDVNFVVNATSGGTMFELQGINSNSNSQNIWNDINTAVTKTEPTYMDDEDLNFDIFQVEKSDLIQPTLAELNGDYTDLLNIDDLLLPDELTQNQPLHPLQISPNININSHSNEINTSMIQNYLLTQCLPTQIFQHQIPQTPHNSLQSNSGMTMGKDFLYDEQNESTISFDAFGQQQTNSKSQMQTLNSNAAFSPGSQSSGSPLMINSITPPPPQNRQQQQHQQQQQSGSHTLISPSSTAGNYLNVAGSSNGKTYGQVQHNPKYTTLHELLMKKEYPRSPDRHTILGQSVPEPSPIMMAGRQMVSPSGLRGMRSAHLHPSSSTSRLSSSAPTHSGLDAHIWARREPRPHLLSTGSLAEATSTSSLSTGVLSPEAPDFSQDEGYSDDDNSDLGYEDCSSDNDSDDDEDKPRSTNNNNMNKSRGRYFWQYNVQAKGPKGQRLVIKTLQEDPHVLNEVTDPVFSANCSVRGIKVQSVKHSGKARRGDGNVLDPDPRKLNSIGKELDKLGRIINDMTPVSELPMNVRPKTRKEKNKLASRACRLKKKANHEANKIKLYGLENEHKRLINGISQMKQILAAKINSPGAEKTGEELSQHLEKIVKNATKLKIAGNSTEYVNRVLERSKNGEPPGLTDF